MIEEDYVSFEIAKLLKEKGFDEICEYKYGVLNVDEGYVLQRFFKPIKNSELIDNAYTAPTHQMALKWLREKSIIITVVYTRYSLQTIGAQLMFGFNIQNVHGESLFENAEVAYDSYEQAEMDAIKYSLENLI